MAEKEPTDRHRYYHYDPSQVAAIIFVVLFSIATILHIFQAYRARSFFLIPFIIGGIFEAIGYAGRMISANDLLNRSAFILQTLLILLGPTLFAASIYMILGRIILLTNGAKFSLIRQRWLTKIFVFGDVLSFLVQSMGGGIMASAQKDPKKIKRGQDILLIGLFVQIFFFGLFILVSVLFQLRGRAHLNGLPSHIQWRKHLYILYVSSMLILVRSIFRVIEYIMGDGGYLLQHEVFLYIFDAVLMLACMVVMNIVHPGEIARLLKEKNERGSVIDLGSDEPFARERVELESK